MDSGEGVQTVAEGQGQVLEEEVAEKEQKVTEKGPFGPSGSDGDPGARR